jgi:hypothetical protein
MHDLLPWFHYWLQFPVCAVNLAITCYWFERRHIWEPREEETWGTIAVEIPDFRH